MKLLHYFNIPTLLTLFRLIFSPLVMPLLLVYLLPYNLIWLNVILASVFVLLSATDFFDGYLARKFNQETTLGRVLDPLADKFLIYATLIALLAAGKIYFYWVVLLIGREFFIMGLRHVALEYNFSVHVSFLGKLKTVFQMITITFIILNPYQALEFQACGWNATQAGLILVTLILTLISAQQYYEKFIEEFLKREQEMVPTALPEEDDDRA